MIDLFYSELETLDFNADAENSRKYINGFIEKVTENNIKDLLPPGSITTATSLVLANAAYFKGQWESKFNPEDTQQTIFHTSSEKRGFVDMMYKKGTFNHGNFF